MTITGEMLIGGAAVKGSEAVLRCMNPATNEALEPAFHGGNEQDVERACALAQDAFDSYRNTSPQERAAFLEAVAEEIEALGDELIVRAMQETALPRPRLEGERARTCKQLRMFADVVRKGHWLNATLDSASDARPDLRMRMVALGPVAVFGASNFPLAFSVAGGDTASALAAGCPVVVKAHSAHLGTSELAGRAVQRAVARCGLHEGVFAMLVGAGNRIGTALVSHPAIKAVGFTGSRAGGLALVNVANSRPEPIPVYAEMSSINPVFLLPGALKARAPQLAVEYVNSLTMGVGQLCTNPGLVLALPGADTDAWKAAVAEEIKGRAAATMLTSQIHAAYERGVADLKAAGGVRELGCGVEGSLPHQAMPVVFETTGAAFLADHAIQNEVFGPSSVLVLCQDEAELMRVTASLEGQLTATVHAERAADAQFAQRLLSLLELKAGRVLVNGFPTGVEVCNAMVHGGPFPSTSDSRSTSVGATAINRFLRPVCYQNLPEEWLPEALRDANPHGLWRLKDGALTQG
jgi:alpha-ketoglutaric semialdehyde dehydrogenase